MKPIWIVDDDQSIRFVLEKALAREELAVRSFSSGRDVMAALTTEEPQVLVSDIRMPGGSGIEACRTITAELPDIPVVMLTSHADSEALFDAIDAGASGYVLKRIGSTELVDAVRTVAQGGSLLDPAVTRPVLDRLRNASRLEEAGAFSDLTDQERRVLANVADGASNREIAERMGLAEKTVRNYVSSILAKLGLDSRAQAAGYAIRNRLPELDEDQA